MSLYVIWKQNYARLKEYDAVPVIHPDTSYMLSEIFEELTISAAYIHSYPYDESYNNWYISYLEPFSLPKKKDEKWLITLGSFSAKYEEVIAYGIVNIKKELRFKRDYVKLVEHRLSELSKEFYPDVHCKDVTFVGMHFRGEDYFALLQYLYGDKVEDLASRGYFIHAMNYFKQRYQNIVFILLSVDNNFLERIHDVRRNGNVAVNPMYKRPGSDLVLLAHCNHSIITYGTFGVTAALFAGGTTIVYDLNVPIGNDGPSLGMNIVRLLPDKWILGNNSHIQIREQDYDENQRTIFL